MRLLFPGYFRPTSNEFEKIWEDCFFAVDANVLLNLYRYSPAARESSVNALNSVKSRIFIPHQAAKDFLRNRLRVTANQADEYTKVIRLIGEIIDNLSNKKKHPFIPDSEHQEEFSTESY